MKIFMTVMISLLMATSLYAADCKEGEKCTKEECAKLGADFKLSNEKCVKVASTEKGQTDCADIVSAGSTAAGKASSSSSASSDTSGATGVAK